MAGSTRTIEQQIADKEAQLARLRDKHRKLENGQKIILGGMLLNEVKNNERTRRWIMQMISEKVTREADKKRLEPLIQELRQMGIATSPSNESRMATV